MIEPAHFHQNEAGIWVRCYHVCKTKVTDWKFWCGITIVNWLEFLPEHLFWFKVPGVKYFAMHILGLS